MKKILIMIVSVFTIALIFTQKTYAYTSIDFPMGSVTYVQGGSSDFFNIKLETDINKYTSSNLYDLTLNFNNYYQNKTQVGYFISRSIVGFSSPNTPQDHIYTLQVGDILIIMEQEIHIMRNNSIVETFVYTELYDLFLTQNVPFDENYQDGYSDGYDEGFGKGKDIGYENARHEFGRYDNGVWYTSEQWGNIEYNRGLQASHSEAFDEGYLKGSNESFLANIKNWIVPAIIVVIILGGFVTIIQKRKDGET